MKAYGKRLCLFGSLLAALTLGAGKSAAAETLVETFDGAEVPSAWTTSGSFTNATNGLVWTYTSAREKPIQSGNPALELQGGTTASKRGTLTLQTPLTNGIGRVAFTVMRDSKGTNQPVRLDLLADGVSFATCEPSIDNLETARVDVAVTSVPLQAVSAFCISNHGLTCAIDDLSIDPFRIFVSVAGPENGDLPLGHETDIVATPLHASENVTFRWTIEPDFTGYANAWTDPHLTLMPAEADLGTTFTLTAHLAEADDPDTFAEASSTFTVSDSKNPRVIDFEDVPTVNYDTNDGTNVPMRGVNWRWFNVCTSDKRDAKIGEKSARFRHTSQNLPAILESQDPFDGVGAVTLHCATFQDNDPVDFELQICGDGEDWSTAGTFSSRDCRDITNCMFVIPVERIDSVCVRIISTAGSGQIANLDDIRILSYGESPPVLAADIPAVAPLGTSTTALFTLLHADGIVRTWTGELDPPSASASFEVTPEDDFLLSFSPTDTKEWGFYRLSVSAALADGSIHQTQAVLRVVSPPEFELVGTSSVAIPGVVDVFVTNVVLHGDNTDRWKTEWTPAPPFANTPSLANKSRYRIADGTTEADLGEHLLTVVLTDSDTTVTATRTFPILVTPVAPILAADIPSVVPLGTTSTVLFTLLNADGIARDWSGSIDPPSPSATFEVTPEDDFLLSFSPTDTNEWGFYRLSVSADLADGSTHQTQAVLRVASPPKFELVGTSSVEMPSVVDVFVTNVVLHSTNTEWKTAWTPDPPFANAPSLSHKSRYRIAAGTTVDDVGEHILMAILTDSDTTLTAMREFPILVLSTNTPPDPGETYVIEAFARTNLSLRADNNAPRWFTPFAVESLVAGTDATNWIWHGDAKSSSGPSSLDFDLSGCTNPVAFFGIRISASADE